MKVQVLNPNNIVQNAFIKETDLSFSLIINTVDKWVVYDTRGNDGVKLSINYYAENSSQDTVELIAENDEDKEVFTRIPFELHDTDQLWILYPKREVYQ
jgi:hypothetical protein